MKELSLGISPCPNDTYMFYGLLEGRIGTHRYRINPFIGDIETLNRAALQGKLDITKVSIYASGLLLEDYVILCSGAAVGRGCGPLVVTRQELKDKPLEELSVAVPGKYTTASLLLGLYSRISLEKSIQMPFHLIIPAIIEGRIDAGVIIHEGRFIYRQYGLHMIIDLGQWWETQSSLPVPLGCIVGKRSLGKEFLLEFEENLRESIKLAEKSPGGLRDFIRSYAQEMSEDVIQKHIQTYVNTYSLDLGREGKRAIKALFREAVKVGLLPEPSKEAFLH